MPQLIEGLFFHHNILTLYNAYKEKGNFASLKKTEPRDFWTFSESVPISRTLQKYNKRTQQKLRHHDLDLHIRNFK